VNLIRGGKIYLGSVLSRWGLTVPRSCSTAIFVWLIMLGVDFFNMEADFGGRFQYGGRFRGFFNMGADSRGSFQYGGRFRGQIYLWRWISNAFVLLGVY
jgi:hypothetical protein